MSLNISISFFSALLSWALAVFLGTQLLSGTFDDRTCQTTCVSVLFWMSFAIAGIGLVFSIGGISIGKSSLIKVFSGLALLVLCGIYAAIIIIGNFGI